MSKFIDISRSTGNPTKQWAGVEDDDDDKTVKSGGSGKNGRKLIEIKVKCCLNNISDQKTAKEKINEILALVIHIHSDDITIIDHNSCEFEFDKWTDKTKLKDVLLQQSKIPLHRATAQSKRRLNRWYAMHTIRTTISLTTIKNHFMVRERMESTRTYLTIHQFALSEWDIAHLGFLQGYNVLHVSKHQTKL